MTDEMRDRLDAVLSPRTRELSVEEYNELRAKLVEAALATAPQDEVAEWQASFDLYDDAIRRGTAMWRAETGRTDVLPDTAKLVAWLLVRLPAAPGTLPEEWERLRMLNCVDDALLVMHQALAPHTLHERFNQVRATFCREAFGKTEAEIRAVRVRRRTPERKGMMAELSDDEKHLAREYRDAGELEQQLSAERRWRKRVEALLGEALEVVEQAASEDEQYESRHDIGWQSWPRQVANEIRKLLADQPKEGE